MFEGETNAVSDMRATIMHKNQTTMPPNLPSHPCHEVEVCRGGEKTEWKVTMGPFFDDRADMMKKGLVRERLVNVGIRPSANITKMKRVTSVCFRITRLMNNQMTSQTRPTSRKEEKATTRMLWLLWKLYRNRVASRKIRKRCFLKEANSPGKTRCKKSWDQFEKYGSPSLRCVKRVSEKKKGPSLGKIQGKNPDQRSPYAMKFEDRSQEETARQQRCAQSKAWNLAKKISSSKRKTRLHSARPQRNGYCRLRQKKRSRKKVCL